MRRHLYRGPGTPETDVSIGPAFALSAVALAAFVAFAFPLAGAAMAGAVAAVVGRRLLPVLGRRLAPLRRRGWLHGARIRAEG